MNLYYKKKKYDDQLNLKEIEVSKEIYDMIEEVSKKIASVREDINTIKAINFYELSKKELPKFKEIELILDIQSNLMETNKLLNNIIKKIYELYALVEKETT